MSGLHVKRHETAWTPLRATKPNQEVRPLPEYPEPEVRARTAVSEEIPRGALTFTKKLDEAGIPYDVRYARGWWPNNAGEPEKIVDSIVVRMGTAWASWVDGRFKVGMVNLPDLGARTANLDQIKAFMGFEVTTRKRKAPDPTNPPKLRLIKGKEGMR